MSNLRAPYRAEGPFVAREAFTYGDATYEPGDVWPIDGLPEWNVWAMWLAQKVDIAPPPPVDKPAKRPRAGA